MTTSTTTTHASNDAELKARHRGMWALGDYPAVAADLIPDLGRVLVDACDVAAGQRVLDVAAGTGNAAIPAVRDGAEVVAADLTPELLEAGARLAEQALTAAEGDRLTWREADAEALPWQEASFDTVLSCVGVMFAPHHQRSADEMLRVCRPGGTLGLLSWTPSGFIGRLFATMKPYLAPPPAGVQPPPRSSSRRTWHVRASRPSPRRSAAARAPVVTSTPGSSWSPATRLTGWSPGTSSSGSATAGAAEPQPTASDHRLPFRWAGSPCC